MGFPTQHYNIWDTEINRHCISGRFISTSLVCTQYHIEPDLVMAGYTRYCTQRECWKRRYKLNFELTKDTSNLLSLALVSLVGIVEKSERVIMGRHRTTEFSSVTLHWRHNDHGGVSNHQPRGCLLNRLFRRRLKQTSKLRVTGLCAGNSPGPVNSPHKGPVTRKMFPFDDVIMISPFLLRVPFDKQVFNHIQCVWDLIFP